MAYTLKTSGLATIATMVVMLDQDGTTLKEFVSSSVNSSKTITGTLTTGTKTWKGLTNFPYWAITANGSFNSTPEIEFVTNQPVVAWTSGISVFAACAQMSTGNDQGGIVMDVPTGWGFAADADSSANFGFTAGNVKMSSTGSPLPLGTTSFSLGGNLTAGTSFDIWYAAAGDTTPTSFNVLNGTDAGWGIGTGGSPPYHITEVCGFQGQGHRPAQYHIVAMFSRELTVSEFGTLHDDFKAVLFDAPVDVALSGITCSSAAQSLSGASSRTVPL